MQAGHTKNIDRQVENKFNAFKKYAKKYNLHWGFVRDIDEELYINNTIYTEDMSGVLLATQNPKNAKMRNNSELA